MALSVVTVASMTMVSLVLMSGMERKSPSSSQKTGPAEGSATQQKGGKLKIKAYQ